MRILFFYSHPFNPSNGGIERVTDIISNCLVSEYGFEVFYLCGKVEGEIVQKTAGIQQSALPYDGFFTLEENVQYFVSFIKHNRIDVVISQSGMWSYMDRMFDLVDAKFISVIHSSPYAEYIESKHNYFIPSRTLGGYFRWLVKVFLYPIYGKYLLKRSKDAIDSHYNYLLEKSDAVVVLSIKYIDDLVKLDPSNAFKVTSIHNPTVIRANKVDFSKKEKVILYVGRLDPLLKCPIELLKIWRVLYNDYPEWRLVFVGEGSGRAEMEKYIARYDIPRVIFEGKKEDVEPYYAKAAIVSLVSRCEGWGMALTEGMERGCVPICYNNYGAAEDIIDDGINGFLVPDGKKKDYADALRRIMSNDDLLAKMSAAAYVKVQQFSSERIAKQWAELICSITK